MATPFLGSGEYDERARRLYDAADWDGALRTLKEGLDRYPHATDLHVGMGFTRLAREEFIWAKHAFEDALALEPEHGDGLLGLGAALLRFGRRDAALELFDRALAAGPADDLDLLLSTGHALYQAGLFTEAHETFVRATRLHPESADAVAALAYTLHRLGDEPGARETLRTALERNPAHHEARIYLGHLLYDRGEWRGALDELERVPPSEHRDPLAICRLLELKCALHGIATDAPQLARWEERLETLSGEPDPLDTLLAELEG